MCLALFGWAAYQFNRGEVYTNTGATKFSPLAWIAKEDWPTRYWGVVASQGIGAIILIVITIVKFGI